MAKKTITFKKSDMTFVTDIDLQVIKEALAEYHNQFKEYKINRPNYILNLENKALERMIELFEEPGLLIVPYFLIDEDN